MTTPDVFTTRQTLQHLLHAAKDFQHVTLAFHDHKRWLQSDQVLKKKKHHGEKPHRNTRYRLITSKTNISFLQLSWVFIFLLFKSHYSNFSTFVQQNSTDALKHSLLFDNSFAAHIFFFQKQPICITYSLCFTTYTMLFPLNEQLILSFDFNLCTTFFHKIL